MLRFFHNGQAISNSAIDRVKGGLVYPCVSVSKGSVVQMVFTDDNFSFAPPSAKYTAIVPATSII